MLTRPEAREIAVDCVEHVGGETDVQVIDVLEDVGITDDESLDTLKRVIVVNKNIGVKRKGHRMKVKDFDALSVEDTVDDAATIIKEKAVSEEG